MDAGEGYVFFGPATAWTKTDWDLSVDVPDVVIWGADGTADNPVPRQGDRLGFNNDQAVIADLVADRIPDLVVVAQAGAGIDNLQGQVGEAYVLRGRASWPAEIDLRIPGSADLVVYGSTSSNSLGSPAVADLDADGEPDLLIGSRAYTDASLGRATAGAVLVFRGRTALSGTWDLGSRVADAVVVGRQGTSYFGTVARIADVDGDGLLDIVASANLDASVPTRSRAGTVFVISGCAGLIPFRDLAIQPADLEVWGADSMDGLGSLDLAVGDIDGDGRADMLVSAPVGDSRSDLRVDAGEVYLVRGRQFTAPVCTIVAAAGPPIDACLPFDTHLDGSATVVAGCGATPQYRWLAGTTVIRGWAPDPTVTVRPGTSTTYTLEVRCSDCAGPCFASASVVVTVDPDVVPPDLANTLRARRVGADVDMLWGAVAEARSYSVFRGVVKDIRPPSPLVEDLVFPTLTLPDVPVPPNDPLYFYRAAGASCSGVEGP